MTITPPSIQVVHASDAPQHTGELKTILQRLKAEQRIADFAALDVSGSPDPLKLKDEDHQGIIVLLTNEIERIRSKVENVLKSIASGKQDIKLIEIIVDNLPYHNNFISFPQDLMPIRARDDMNKVWNGIEDDLKAIFPKPPEQKLEPASVKKSDSKILLKVSLIAIMLAVLATIQAVYLSDNYDVADAPLPFLTPVAFSFLIPYLIRFRDRTDLEWLSIAGQGQKRIEGEVNWKQLLIRTAIAFFIMLIATWYFVSDGFLDSAPILGVAVALPFVLYRRKSNQNMEPVAGESDKSQSRKYLKAIGRYLIFLFIAMVYWWAVLVAFQNENSLHYLFIMPVITTLGIFVIRFAQKRTQILHLEH